MTRWARSSSVGRDIHRDMLLSYRRLLWLSPLWLRRRYCARCICVCRLRACLWYGGTALRVRRTSLAGAAAPAVAAPAVSAPPASAPPASAHAHICACRICACRICACCVCARRICACRSCTCRVCTGCGCVCTGQAAPVSTPLVRAHLHPPPPTLTPFQHFATQLRAGDEQTDEHDPTSVDDSARSPATIASHHG